MKKIAISILFAILFTITLIYIPTSAVINLETLTASINGYGMFFSILVLLTAYISYKMLFTTKYKLKFNIIIAITSFFLAFSLLLGKYYIHNFSIQALYSNISTMLINLIFLAVFFIAIYISIFILFNYINDLEINDEHENSSRFAKILDFVLNKHSIIVPFLIILLCGLPYIVFFYPGTVQDDGNVQLQQFLGNYGRTSHHPYVSTIILGTCFKIGSSIGNDNLGIFTYTFLQFLLSSFVFAYMIDFMKKIKAPLALRFITLIYFSIFTIWPINAYTFVKDTIYYLIFVAIVIKIYKYVTEDEKQINIIFNIGFAFLCIGLCMFRNNGIEVVLLTLISLFFLNKNKKRIIILACVTVSILAYNYVVQPLIYNAVELEEGSIREALSVPIQQIALTVKTHGDEISPEDKAFIEEIHHLSFEEISSEYIPEISDPIKNKFEYEPTNEQLSNYFKLWFKLLLKHPMTYIDAYCNNFYGYFYPDRTEYKDGLGWYLCHNTEQVDVHFNPAFEKQRTSIENFAYFLRNIPLVGIFYSTGIYTWFLIVIFAYLLNNKQYKYLLILVPSILSLVVCLLSPVGAYIRYSQPIMANMPLLLCLIFNKK